MSEQPAPRRITATQPRMGNPIHFLAFGFGSGLAAKAPGTFGTLAALPIWWLLVQFSWPVYVLVLVLMMAVGPWLCGRAADDLGVHDHGGIVWDEIVGYLLTMLWVLGQPLNVYLPLVGFLLFRLFDIVKPWPIGWLDRQVQGGVGIMLDDLVAALYAGALLALLASQL